MTYSFKRTTLSLLAVLASIALAGVASAGPITTMTFSTGSNGNSTQQATAIFSFGPGYLGLTLNNTGNITSISSILDGFNFTASNDGSAMLLATAGTAVVTCGDSSCTDSTSGIQSASYWSASVAGDSITMVAGQGYHPYGIVNDTINTEVSTFGGKKGGLSNAQHNPYLEGPATFNFLWPMSSVTSVPSVSNVQFLFGTSPSCTDGTDCIDGTFTPPGTVPEPGTLALFGAGLLGFAVFAGRRRRAARRS